MLVLADDRSVRQTGRVHSERPIVLVAVPGVSLLDIAGPADVFAAARELSGERLSYRPLVATLDGRPVKSASGIRIVADLCLSEAPTGADTVLVGGTLRPEAELTDSLLSARIKELSESARRIGSVCTGAFALATAGVLDGRTATTHWAAAQRLADAHPSITVEPDRIFVRDGSIATSAGVSAGIDLALALVEEDGGSELARRVAQWLVLFLRRPGGQSQFSAWLRFSPPAGTSLAAIVDDVVARPTADHRVETLAARWSISERHVARLFSDQLRVTPGRFVERVRVEAAGAALSGGCDMFSAALQSGFGSTETMRRAFIRVLGVTPGTYRDRFATSHRPASLQEIT